MPMPLVPLPSVPVPVVPLVDPGEPVPVVPLVDPGAPVPVVPLVLDPGAPVPVVPLVLEPGVPVLVPVPEVALGSLDRRSVASASGCVLPVPPVVLGVLVEGVPDVEGWVVPLDCAMARPQTMPMAVMVVEAARSFPIFLMNKLLQFGLTPCGAMMPNFASPATRINQRSALH